MSMKCRVNLFGITSNSRRIDVRHIITENLYYIMFNVHNSEKFTIYFHQKNYFYQLGRLKQTMKIS